MPTIIDSLLITLGFDTKQVKKGADETKKDLAALKKEAQEAQKAHDNATRSMVEGYRRVRNEVLSLLAIFTAGQGFKQMVGGILTADAALGRFATNVGMSIQTASAWQGVVTRMGGSAEGFTASVSNLTQAWQQFALTGQSNLIPYLNALKISWSDVRGQMKPVDQLLLEMNRRVHGMNPAQARALLSPFGLDEGTLNAVIQNTPAQLQAQLQRQRGLGVPSQEDARASQELLANVRDLQRAFMDLVRTVVREVGPTITTMLQAAANYVLTHKGEITKTIHEWLGRIVEFFRNLPQFTSHWQAFIGALLGAVALEKLIGIARGIALIRMAMGFGLSPALLAAVGLGAGFAINEGMEAVQRAGDPAGGVPANETVEARHERYNREWQNMRSRVGGAVSGAARGAQDWLGRFIDANLKPPTGGYVDPRAMRTENNIARMTEYLRRLAEGDFGPAISGTANNMLGGRGATGGFTGSGGTTGGFGAYPGGTGGFKPNQRAAEIFRFFLDDKRYPPAFAAAATAAIMLESSGDPGARGDHGHSAGIGQWSQYRANQILRRTGINVTTAGLYAQLEAYHREMAEGIDPGAGRAYQQLINAGNTPYQAGMILRSQNSRPYALWHDSMQTGADATRYFNRYHNGWLNEFMPRVAPGPRAANSNTSNNSTSTINIGDINVHTNANNAADLSHDLDRALEQRLLTAHSNTGLR